MTKTSDNVNSAQQEQQPTPTDTREFGITLELMNYCGTFRKFFFYAQNAISEWMTDHTQQKKKKRKSLKG